MKVVDMHCDTISELCKDYRAGGNASILEDSMMISLRRMQAGDYGLQNSALYIDLDRAEGKPFEYYVQLLGTFYNEMGAHRGMISIVKSYKDIERNWKRGKMSVPLTAEEGDVCRGELGFLHNFHRLGARMMILTWNYPNELAFPNKREVQESGRSHLVADTENGLTGTGARSVREMGRLGVTIDISYLNDAGIWDVLRHIKRPFVASHSNARIIAFHARNLTDEVIHALTERGEAVGVSYYSCFLHDFTEGESEISRISHMVDHTKHIRNIGGIGCLGLGSNFDGIERRLEIKDTSQLFLLADATSRESFSQLDIEAVFYKSVLGLYRETL